MNALRTFLAFATLALVAVQAQASNPSGFGNFGFGELEEQLRLNPEQKSQFDRAVAASQRALLSVAFVGMQMKDRIGTELSKPKPDFDALARAQNDAIEQTRPLFREARVEWARLYAMMDPNQVRIAREFVDQRLEGFERLATAALDTLSKQLKH